MHGEVTLPVTAVDVYPAQQEGHYNRGFAFVEYGCFQDANLARKYGQQRGYFQQSCLTISGSLRELRHSLEETSSLLTGLTLGWTQTMK